LKIILSTSKCQIFILLTTIIRLYLEILMAKNKDIEKEMNEQIRRGESAGQSPYKSDLENDPAFVGERMSGIHKQEAKDRLVKKSDENKKSFFQGLREKLGMEKTYPTQEEAVGYEDGGIAEEEKEPETMTDQEILGKALGIEKPKEKKLSELRKLLQKK